MKLTSPFMQSFERNPPHTNHSPDHEGTGKKPEQEDGPA